MDGFNRNGLQRGIKNESRNPNIKFFLEFLGFFGLILFSLVSAQFAIIAIAMGAEPIPTTCETGGRKLSEIQFAGTFNWISWDPTVAGMKTQSQQMKIVIGALEGPGKAVDRKPSVDSAYVSTSGAISGPATIVAHVMSGSTGECQAICEIKAMEKTGPYSPATLDMSCQGTQFGALSAPATVLWSLEPGQSPKIRFGSWLNGYKQAELKVSVDRYADLSRETTPSTPQLKSAATSPEKSPEKFKDGRLANAE